MEKNNRAGRKGDDSVALDDTLLNQGLDTNHTEHQKYALQTCAPGRRVLKINRPAKRG